MNPLLVKRIALVSDVLDDMEELADILRHLDTGEEDKARKVHELLEAAVSCETHKEFFPHLGEAVTLSYELREYLEHEAVICDKDDNRYRGDVVEEAQDILCGKPFRQFSTIWEEREIKEDPQTSLGFD